MLFEVVTIYLHYMRDRQERFDLKISKLKLLRKQKTPTFWMPLRKIKLKINFKVNYPFKVKLEEESRSTCYMKYR